MKICMVGAGYVGLVSSACFSEFGWNVHCVDTDVARLETLRRGEMPIYEPELQGLVDRNTRAGRLHFSDDLAAAVAGAEVVFLAVGTPMRRGDGHADLSFIFAAIEMIAPHLTSGAVVATKSTVPVGTSREIERRLRQLRPSLDAAVCSNPEFLREGSAIDDFMHPDRILVGCDHPRAREVMQKLYKPIALRNAPHHTSRGPSRGADRFNSLAQFAIRAHCRKELLQARSMTRRNGSFVQDTVQQ